MPGNLFIYEYPHLRVLEKLTSPFYLQKKLEYHYLSKDTIQNRALEEERENYYRRISDYISQPRFKRNKKSTNQEEIAKPLGTHSDFRQIALKASSYFQQGLEMFKTALSMGINSSPLVEYYGFLQCVKGSALTQLEISEGRLFSYHGIRAESKLNIYPKAIIKAYGVFQVVLLISDVHDEMNSFFKGEIDLNLDSLLKKIPTTPASSFIVSYLLSTLVRYHPDKWQTIYRGLKDDLFLQIREFRRSQFPESMELVFPYFLR